MLKKSLFLAIFVLLHVHTFMYGQSSQNYVRKHQAKVEGKTDLIDVNLRSEKGQETTFVDGLGRPVQTVIRWGSPQGLDQVMINAYNAYGQETTAYLPYIASNSHGNIYLTAATDQASFYNGSQGINIPQTDYPFSKSVMELSPLGRGLEQGAPGAAWQPHSAENSSDPDVLGKTIKMEYSLVGANEVLKREYSGGALGVNGFFGEGTLTKTQTFDENGNLTEEFTDAYGKLILRRMHLTSTGEVADTYYVYGDDGMLYYVLPPELNNIIQSANPTAQQLEEYAFKYIYDERKRMIEKHVPGMEGNVYMVYDDLDRLVLIQDPVQRGSNEWIFTKYDIYNRPVSTGFYRPGISENQSQMQSRVNSFYLSNPRFENLGGSVLGYTNQSFPNVSDELQYLSVNYYDDYSVVSNWGSEFDFTLQSGWSLSTNQGTYSFPSTFNDHVVGQQVAVMTRIMDSEMNTSAKWIKTVSYYDDKYRLIQSIDKNDLLDTKTTASTLLNFAGWSLGVRMSHDRSGHPMREVARTFNYNDNGGLESVDHEYKEGGVSNGITRLFENEYNKLGQVVKKGLHVEAGTPRQSIDYQYNIRGWLTGINSPDDLTDPSAEDSDYFSMAMLYADDITVNAAATPAPALTKTLIANTSADYSKVNQGDNGFEYGYYTTETASGTFSTSSMNIGIHNWERSGSTPQIGRIYMHPRNGKPSVRRYTVGSNEELQYSGTVLIEGKFWDRQTGNSNGANGFVTVDGVVKYNERIIEGSTETDGYIAFSITVDVNVGTTIDFGILSLNNSSYDGRNMEATISTLHAPNTSQDANAQYNGNISAIQWKTHSDDQGQLFTYQYDELNRLTKADYSKGTMTGATWSANSDLGAFSVNNLSYDLNGNILSLNRQSKEIEIQTMDALNYTYEGNRLLNVADAAGPGGFVDGNSSANDYAYDLNGNIKQDKNKGVNVISYNHLNLPILVQKSTDKYIEYIYDAAGMKIQQIVHDDANVTTTDYSGEYIYEDDQVSLIQHEEGRLVQNPQTGQWDYQYHLKDHLGNVRTSFTASPSTWEFVLNYEGNSPDQDQFEDIDPIISNDVFDHTDAGSTYTKSQLLTGAEGSRVGAVLTLPVRKGDVISAEAFVKYESPTSTTNVISTTVAMSLIGALTGQSVAINEFGTQTINSAYPPSNDGAIIGTPGFPVLGNVKGFLNLLFVDENGSPTVDNSRFAYDQIANGAGNQNIGGPIVPHAALNIDDFVAPANGIIIVYVSNEQENLTNMYFDDVKVTIEEHPIIQTDDYYPFGLTFNSYQRVTSEKNKYLYNGKEIQDALNINWHDYGARMYIADIGRWGVVDPLSAEFLSWSPYNFTMNNPLRFIDPDGRSPMDIIIKGTKKEKEEYLSMLHASTGNNYSLDDSGKLKNDGADANFKGTKSAKLASVIDKGIKSSTKYNLALTGGTKDDKNVFIDSYELKKIDVSDLKKLGKASTALQGAAIGHFLNEIQAPGGFDSAHKASLGVEGVIYGELAGDKTITKRKDYPTGTPQGGYQNVIYEYNSKNKFELKQGATSTTKGTGQFVGPIEVTETEVVHTGELKSVKKVK